MEIVYRGVGGKQSTPKKHKDFLKQGRAVYSLLNREIIHDGIKQKITGTIKSLVPWCTGKPSGNPKHPLNCHKQEYHLVDLFNKRSDAKLKNTAGASRIGERGFRHDYAKKTEVQLHSLSDENKNAFKSSLCTKEKGNECPKLGGNAARKQPPWIPGETYSWPSHIALAKKDVAVAMGFVEPASKKPENSLPAD